MPQILSDEEFYSELPRATSTTVPEEDVYQEGGGHDKYAVQCVDEEDE